VIGLWRGAEGPAAVKAPAVLKGGNAVSQVLALDSDLASAKPKTLRYLVLHAAARLVRGGRKRCVKIQASLPWTEAITAWQRIDALPQAP
jgi:hypothetical protein